MAISDHIVRVCAAGQDLTAVSFNDQYISWDALALAIESLEALLDASGLAPNHVVGLLGRNALEPVSALISLLGARRAVLLINENRASSQVADEIASLKLACILGAREDFTPELLEAIAETPTQCVAVDVRDGQLSFETIKAQGQGPFRLCADEVLIEIQTSGTTGKPKRIPVMAHTLEAALRDGVRRAKGTVEQAELEPKSSPTLMFSPLVHTSGVFNTLMAVFEVRPIVLFEKFDVEPFRLALVKYRPKFVPLPPTALKMMVDSDATREDFSSVRAVRSGTAPLSVDLQLAFEQKFDVPVLTTYGATEFMGAVASWTLADYREYSAAKRGSVGRPSAGVRLRILDAQTGEEVPAGEQGVLEAKVDRVDGGKDWIRTTDLASLDADGFLFIHGRTDDAIIRGGFKVMAGKVAEAICTYPGVMDAIVLGRPDERLGEVPVAVVESYPDAEGMTEAALKAHAKEMLTHYEVPVRFLLHKLPRTVSDKVSRPETHKLIDRFVG